MKKKFGAEVGKVLQLMIHSLYANHSIFLRELISNASDALDKVRYCEIEDSKLLGEKLEITVKIDKANQTLIIQDNGVGMDAEDLENNLGTIASSGTQKFLETLKSTQHNAQNTNKNDAGANANANAHDTNQLIGQFGVGFYSAFIVADYVTVHTTKLDINNTGVKTYTWESDGQSDYKISESEEKLERGTIIKLKMKTEDLEYLEKYKLEYIINTYSDHIGFPIKLIDEENKEEQINRGMALWTRQQSEVSNEEYEEFYHDISHSPDKPWMTLHNKVEGNINYTSLLYIPTNKPYDLFHPDRKTRVKLYIKRVFIAEDNIDLIPRYLRFIRGVIDSDDLPLNISRETLQYNNKSIQISRSIVKRVFSSLKKKAQDEPEEYAKFWDIFGEVMKEGLCEPTFDEKEALLEICRFHSTKSPDKLISLDQYIDGMIDEQEQIFYMTGDTIKNMIDNPQLEGFKKRNIEVLLLKDTVDDFWLSVIHQYKNKEIKVITTADINLDKIVQLKNDDNSKESKDNDDTKDKDGNDDKNNKINKDFSSLVSYIKKTLGNRIKDVRISTKLVDSPACLSISEGGMNIKMEKMLIDQKQLMKKAPKILEINPHHSILKTIYEYLLVNDDFDKNKADKADKADKPSKTSVKHISEDYIKDLIEIVLAQAYLTAGETLDDPCIIAGVIDKLVCKGLKN